MFCLCFSHTQQQLTDPSNVDTWQCHKQNPVIRRLGGCQHITTNTIEILQAGHFQKAIHNTFKEPDSSKQFAESFVDGPLFLFWPPLRLRLLWCAGAVTMSESVWCQPPLLSAQHVLISSHQLLTLHTSSLVHFSLSKCLSLPLPSYLFVYFV